jgi:hypothetical protein
MQKNTKTYLLLAVVALIWGIICVKVFNWMPKDEVSQPVNVVAAFIPKEQKKKDSFKIKANYRDPFLGTLTKETTKTVKTKGIKSKTEETPAIVIQYTGFITDTDSKQKIFFITINGQQRLMKVNERVEGIRLLSGNSEKVQILCNSRKQYYPLQR